MILQKQVFRDSEGDAWYRRNRAALAERDWSLDPVCMKVSEIMGGQSGARVLEVGCGDGSRLHYLAHAFPCKVHGIDPSSEAIVKATGLGVPATTGTADELPFDDGAIDVLIFGFCLYLCDDVDLFAIAAEADRVLAHQGWLLILDFDSKAPTYKPYSHREGIRSRHMSCKNMFLWHPWYSLESESKFGHQTMHWTDDKDEWVSLVCLRKYGLDKK